jgi:hypothetical protein
VIEGDPCWTSNNPSITVKIDFVDVLGETEDQTSPVLRGVTVCSPKAPHDDTLTTD